MITKGKRAQQIRLTLGLGNEPIGSARRSRWKQAALIIMHGHPKFFNAWIRLVLDAEADRILGK